MRGSVTMLDQLAKIRFARFRFHLRAETPLVVPAYKGSTLRGGFGISLKDAVCVIEHRDCDRCLLRAKCAYPYLFETPVPAGSRRMASLEHAPHPFVIEPPLDTKTTYAPGDELCFGLVLVGRAIDYLPYFIFGFEKLGQKLGIGKAIRASGSAATATGCRAVAPQRGLAARRGRFSVEAVSVANGDGEETLVYSGGVKILNERFLAGVLDGSRLAAPSFSDRSLTLSFLTPARLVFERRLVTVPELHIVVRNLLRRLANLTYFHCGGELALDFRALIDKARAVRLVENHTRWREWERYSARQDARIKMGGVVGQARYDGDVEQLVPLLALGEVLHVGKGTGFGLGGYTLGWYRAVANATNERGTHADS